jgi:hypothetical protein
LSDKHPDDDGIKIKFEHECVEPSSELNTVLIKKMQLGASYVSAYKKFKAQLKVKVALSLLLVATNI